MNKFFQYPPISATSSGNLAASASSGGGSNGTVTLSAAGSTLDRRTIQSIAWCYSTTPSTGFVRVYNGTSSGSLMFETEVLAQGLDGWVFNPPLAATPGNAITCIILQAGSSVIGRLQAYGPVV